MAARTVNSDSLVSKDTCGRFCAKPVDTNSATATLKANASRTRFCPRKLVLISRIDGWLENSVRTGQFAVKRTACAGMAQLQNHVGPNALVRAGERSSPQAQLSYQGIALVMPQIPRKPMPL